MYRSRAVPNGLTCLGRALFLSVGLLLAAEGAVAKDGYDRTGEASWYGARYQGRTTASGVPFDMNALTAAHRNLPFGTLVRVTNLENERAVFVRITDRGPYARGRIIDLSRRAADLLGFEDAGITRVRVQVEREARPAFRIQNDWSAPGYLTPVTLRPPPGMYR